ncbi:hypothetical protein AgCh_018428 [Apium graveolens]
MEVFLDLCHHDAIPAMVVRNSTHVLPREFFGRSIFELVVAMLKWLPIWAVDIILLASTRLDYEYASYNPSAYNLANHFCEMAANYHSKTPHILDYNIYPGHEPSETEVKRLVNDVEKYTLVNHLFWGLWGIISERIEAPLMFASEEAEAEARKKFVKTYLPGKLPAPEVPKEEQPPKIVSPAR